MSRKPEFARIGPVHFQPLEWELEPVSRYLRGHLLNAGCGNRDIGSYLRNAGIERLTNYDIASTIAGAVLGPLESMPFADAQFDSILCNAVLEHVASAEAVVSELVRVLRPGGHAILTVPFLQPFHECPLDFRRYTRDGLVTLGEGAESSGGPFRPFGSANARLDRLGDRSRKEEPPAALGSVAGDLPGNQNLDPDGSAHLAQCQHLSDRLRPILIRG
jgi:SAM-dependent methyltransferase